MRRRALALALSPFCWFLRPSWYVDAGLVRIISYSWGPKGLSPYSARKKKPVGSSYILQLERVTRQNNRRRHHHHHHHLLYYNNAPVCVMILCGIVEKGFSLFLLKLFNSFSSIRRRRRVLYSQCHFRPLWQPFLVAFFPSIFYCPLSAGARKNQEKRRGEK